MADIKPASGRVSPFTGHRESGRVSPFTGLRDEVQVPQGMDTDISRSVYLPQQANAMAPGTFADGSIYVPAPAPVYQPPLPPPPGQEPSNFFVPTRKPSGAYDFAPGGAGTPLTPGGSRAALGVGVNVAAPQSTTPVPPSPGAGQFPGARISGGQTPVMSQAYGAQPFVPVPAPGVPQYASMPPPGAPMPALPPIGGPPMAIMDSPATQHRSSGRFSEALPNLSSAAALPPAGPGAAPMPLEGGPSEASAAGPEAIALLEQKQELIDFLEAEVERLSQPVPNELEERVAFLEKLLSGAEDGLVPVHAPVIQELQQKAQGKRYVGHLSQAEAGAQDAAFDGKGPMPTLSKQPQVRYASVGATENVAPPMQPMQQPMMQPMQQPMMPMAYQPMHMASAGYPMASSVMGMDRGIAMGMSGAFPALPTRPVVPSGVYA